MSGIWPSARTAKHLAAEVRLNLYDYTIAVNGKPWDKTSAVSGNRSFTREASRSSHRSGSRASGPWPRTVNWCGSSRLRQLWHQMLQPGRRQAGGHRCPEIRQVDGGRGRNPWTVAFNELVTDLVFSPDEKPHRGGRQAGWEIPDRRRRQCLERRVRHGLEAGVQSGRKPHGRQGAKKRPIHHCRRRQTVVTSM